MREQIEGGTGMKKVWVLEKWATPEEMAQTLADFEEMARDAEERGESEEFITKTRELADKVRERNAANPDGMWRGSIGRVNYKQFCEVAKDELRMSDKSNKYRVVEAQIKDDAHTWVKYTDARENVGVMKYLMATK